MEKRTEAKNLPNSRAVKDGIEGDVTGGASASDLDRGFSKLADTTTMHGPGEPLVPAGGFLGRARGWDR